LIMDRAARRKRGNDFSAIIVESGKGILPLLN
jgi:hypothetical protein